MTRRLCGLAALLALSASAVEPDEFGMRLMAFDKPYQLFVQEFCGWKEPSPEVLICNPAMGHLSYKRFQEARKAAMRLFGLAEKN